MDFFKKTPQLMKNCFNYQISIDTAGKPVYARQCYCGTTACRKMNIESEVHPLNTTELTPEEERAFYDKVFGRN